MPEKPSEPAPQDSVGVPSEGAVETPHENILGGVGMKHWKQSIITQPGLDDRGDIFFAAIEMTRMPMILTDPNQPDNPIVFANNAFLDLTRYELDEVMGRNCRFLQGAQTDRSTVAVLRDAIAEHRAVGAEILNYRKDGSPFWNAVFIGPVYDQAGKLLYFFASQLDVSQRRESEEAMRQAQKMDSIGQLTAGVAHDFNNLLQVITASLERMKTRRDDPTAFERYHLAASTAADRGAKLTSQLLAFARRSRLQPRSVDLSGLIGSIGELLDSAVGARADLRLNLRRRLPEVQLDPVHLEMALINIVINARDAMPKGGAITVVTDSQQLDEAAARSLKPGEYVVLEVRDTGVGMPPQVLARATEPFYTTKAPGEGTGLGLAMAHGFATQSGGRLEVYSEEGVGTTVRILFPVATKEATEGKSASVIEPREVDPTGSPLILIIDDNPDIAAIAAESLAEAGYRTLVAHSAEEGLKLFAEAGKVDLVFSDVIMPGGMNGLELAKQIRARSEETPVLLTTGYSDEMVIDSPSAEEFDVLGKPYRRTELVDRVQAGLRRGVRPGPGRKRSDFGVVQA